MNSARFILVAAALTLSSTAFAETADGNGALALAALVAENSPLLGATDKAGWRSSSMGRPMSLTRPERRF